MGCLSVYLSRFNADKPAQTGIAAACMTVVAHGHSGHSALRCHRHLDRLLLLLLLLLPAPPPPPPPLPPLFMFIVTIIDALGQFSIPFLCLLF